MSRIAKSPVTIPSGVEVTLTSNSITVKSGAGTLVQALHASVEVNQEGEELTFLPRDGGTRLRFISSVAECQTSREYLSSVGPVVVSSLSRLPGQHT